MCVCVCVRNVSVCVCSPAPERTPDTFVSEPRLCPGEHVIHNLVVQSYCQKMREKKSKSKYGIDVKQDKFDLCVAKATSLDSLSITPLLTPSALQLRSTECTNLADVKVVARLNNTSCPRQLSLSGPLFFPAVSQQIKVSRCETRWSICCACKMQISAQ